MMKYLFMLLSILPLEGLAQDIEVQALFAGAAVLVIDGRRELLRQGEAKSGVTLLSADTEKAVIETAGRKTERSHHVEFLCTGERYGHDRHE